jgi:inner membrane protein
MNISQMNIAGTPGARLGLKLVVIMCVILGLLVPLNMIRGVASERKDLAWSVGEDIIEMNGGRPSVIGPLLIVPITVYTVVKNNQEVETIETIEHVVILPDTLDIQGNLQSEIRQKGIYRVPIFSGDVHLVADFLNVQEKLKERLVLKRYRADWENAWYSVDLTDKRSIKAIPTLSIDGSSAVPMKSAETSLGWTSSSLRYPAGLAGGTGSRLDINLKLGGGGAFYVYPFGGTVSCSLVSDWVAPSFTGYVVPSSHSISDTGFEANWFVPESSRPYPESFLTGDFELDKIREARFGVEFFQPVSVYHKTERALKYGLLFIIVPFIVFFMFELFTRRRIHPLQYLMIGMADVFFYLLLLSLSEHIPFIVAYALGVIAVCMLVSFYSSAVLGGWKRGLVLMPTLGGIYFYLYIALESEDYALLVGAIGVFAILAAVMISTRHIDWYRAGAAERTDEIRQ